MTYSFHPRQDPWLSLPGAGWHSSERLDRLQALRWSTTSRPPGGEGVGQEGLVVGKVADLVVLSRNPLAVGEDEILQIAVEATYLQGELVFEGPSASP